jgi:lipopolysaccharide export system permease protein
LKILDRYTLLSFIRNLAFGILSFLIIFILIDIFENLDKFIDKGLSFPLIIEYYIYFIPEILKLITPVGMLLAALFTTSRFNTYSEMTAINSSGISIYRYALPIFIFGIFVTAFSIYFNGWLVPEFNSKKIAIERNYLDKHRIIGFITNFHIQDAENRIMYISNYDENLRTSSGISIQIFEIDDPTRLLKRIDIKTMNWDSLHQQWHLSDIYIRKFDTLNNEMLEYINNGYANEISGVGRINITPDQIIKRQLKPDELMLSDLDDFISSLKESGQDATRVEVDYYSKISFPFANLVTILFGISLNSNRRKGGAALQFGIAILVSFLYLGFVKISQVFGYNGEISPLLTAWLANIIFLVIAIINLVRLNFLPK